MRKVRIKTLPKAKYGYNVNFGQLVPEGESISEPKFAVSKTLKPVPRSQANLEAEKGETVVTNLNYDGFPEQYMIGGNRHSNGGTPLNLPGDSFIFSRDKNMKIKDAAILKEFGKPAKGSGFTPADLAKKYDLNSYKKVLLDPNSDNISKETAELMIANYNLKLAKLALAQESMKGFPQGIPAIAMPYIITNNIDPADFVGNNKNTTDEIDTFQMGGQNNTGAGSPGFVSPYVPDPNEEEPVIETSQKNYTKSGLPKDAVVKNPDAKDLKVGEYVKMPDGKYKKVTGFSSQLSGSQSGPEGYQQFYGSKIDDDVKSANAILSRLSKQKGSGVTYNSRSGKYDVTGASKKNISLEDQALLTRVSSYNEATPEGKTLGASKYGFKVGTQNYQGTDLGFVGWVTPELVEYQYWSANNPGKTVKDYEALPAEEKVGNRKNYLQYLGYDPSQGEIAEKINKPEELYTPSFVGTGKNRKEGTLVDRVQKTFPRDMFRPIHEDDYVFGTEHADFYKFNKQTQFEDVKDVQMEMVWICQDGNVSQISKEEAGGAGYLSQAAAIAACKPELAASNPAVPTEWWLQDIVKTAGAFGDMHRIKKYMPWAAPYDPVLADPTFYDPTRELAANAEQMNIGTQGAAMFAGPQAFSSRFSGIQGQGARNAADILGRYNNLNVGVSNQFAGMNAAALSEANKINRDISQDLYDKTTIVNQQFDNAKAMARQNLRQGYIDAITNRANAQVLNSMFPQYNISPLTGGMMHFTKGRPITPTAPQENDVMQVASDYMKINPGFTPAQYFEAAKMKMGMQPSHGFMPDEGFLQGYMNMVGGM